MVIEEEEEEIAESPKSFRSLGSRGFIACFTIGHITLCARFHFLNSANPRPSLAVVLSTRSSFLPHFLKCAFFPPFPTGKKKVESGSRGRDKKGNSLGC